MSSKTYAINRRAKFDYVVVEEFVAGIVLEGQEVKSIRNGGADLKGSYITISRNNEAWLTNAHIKKYAFANIAGAYDSNRPRKLLLNKNELKKLEQARESKFTIVPLVLFSGAGKIKLRLGTAKGKKKFDKRLSIKRRDVERQENRKFKS